MARTLSRPWTGPLTILLVVTLTAACEWFDTRVPAEDPVRDDLGSWMHVLNARCDTDAFDGLARSPQELENLVSGADLVMSTVHDCQQFIMPDQTLGPLAAILVSTTAVQQTDFTGGVVVGEIVVYDAIQYEPLGISQGVSCLEIASETGTGGDVTWSAKIRRPGGGRSCKLLEASDPEAVMEINRLTYGGPGNTGYPSTGRWMWDGTVQFIGVRCGNGWCEIGRGFNGTSQLTNIASVPGWSDEQVLSVFVSGALEPAWIIGRIEPHESVFGGPPPDFGGANGAPVARITINGDNLAAVQFYADQFKLNVTNGGTTAHGVLRVRKPASGGQLASTDLGTWTAVHHNPHTPHSGPGTTRWAWKENDEGLWYWCDSGCCRNDGIDGLTAD